MNETMRIQRRITGFFAVLAAAFAMTVATASPAAAESTCTDWSYVSVPGVEDAYARVPSVGHLTGAINCTLRLGNYDNGAVAVLQWLSLNTCHRAGLVVDGDYGPRTRDAVTWMQAAAGIAADGVYGPQTRVRALEWAAWRGPDGAFIGCRRVA